MTRSFTRPSSHGMNAPADNTSKPRAQRRKQKLPTPRKLTASEIEHARSIHAYADSLPVEEHPALTDAEREFIADGRRVKDMLEAVFALQAEEEAKP